VFGSNTNEKIYIEKAEFSDEGGLFYIHIGGNIWISTKSVHRNHRGLYTYEYDLSKEAGGHSYEKMWKCPYCHSYWPIGMSCQNKECPSKYR
jgi:hypothetical protein